MIHIIRFVFFLSGFCSLVLENLWVHHLTLIFGGTTLAVVTVLSAYMSGLALGSYFGGRWSNSVHHPARVYGLLEGAVALYAMAFPWLLKSLPFFENILLETSSGWGILVLRFLLCSLFLLVPTSLMGATLPILSRFVAFHRTNSSSEVGILYSLNTFGAVFGTLGSGFFLLPYLGLHSTLLVVCTLLFLVAGCMFVSARPPLPNESSPIWDKTDEYEEPSEALFPGFFSPYLSVFVLTSIAISGGLAMGCQVLWTRSLSMVIGSSTYSFTLILSIFLASLALGAHWGSRLVQNTSQLLSSWSSLLFVNACFVMGGSLVFEYLPGLFTWLVYQTHVLQNTDPIALFAVKSGVAAIPIALPTFCMGSFFPIALKLYQKNPKTLGSQVGKLYAMNTLGAIIGSVLVGFFFLPTLGIKNSFLVFSLFYLSVSVFLALLADRKFSRRLVPLCLLFGLLFLFAPDWNSEALNAGAFRLSQLDSSSQVSAIKRSNVLFYKEGVNTTVAVLRYGKRERILKVNGKTDGSAVGDAPTQIALAVYPLLHHPSPENVLLIGWGTGMTAGAALQFPIRSLTAVELEPAIVRASNYFRPWNMSPLRDSRLQLLYNDGRSFLATTRKQFDVIISEPSNPWIHGVANLFTIEFFQQVRHRLSPQGIFCQWLQSYEISNQNYLAVLRSLSHVFSHVTVFKVGEENDTLLLASQRPFTHDLRRIKDALHKPSMRSLFSRMKITSLSSYALRYVMCEKQMKQIFQKEDISLLTDNHNFLAYTAPLDLLFHRKSRVLGPSTSPLSRFHYHLGKYFTFNNAPVFSYHNQAFWFDVCISLLQLGVLERAGEYIGKLPFIVPKAPYHNRLSLLLQLMKGKGREPGSLETGPHSSMNSPSLSQWLRHIKKDFHRQKREICQKELLPLMKGYHFPKQLPNNLLYFVGVCYLQRKRYPSALYSFYLYLNRSRSKND